MLTPYQQAIANLYNQRSGTYDQGDFHPKLVDLLLSYLDVKPQQNVLDIATGTGLMAVECSKKVGDYGYVIGVDIAELMLKKAQEKAQILNLNNLEFLEADIENLELPKQKFERISCCAAMVMFNDISNLLNRCYDWLKLGGKIGFNYWSETSFIEGYTLSKIAPKYNINFPHWHKKIGSKETCYNLLKSVGFKNIEIHQDQLGHYVNLETVKNKWQMMINFPVNNNNLFPFQTLSKEKLEAAKLDYYQELETRLTPKGIWNEIMTLTVIAEK
ncbi:methyltransferase domain-containing protein [Crocosphaera sp.]|uniref:class I SAM-dependent methyltransferase n=1 Tax=Crocosphaera sp. TaxID=2729996 RepID=UPI00262F43AE|nr:methyltransferase domain-containing protein [Crocosphaera sp.]MDJ0578463.1 methyltransferase domain-containing protein [Crocosphaera sp.]